MTEDLRQDRRLRPAEDRRGRKFGVRFTEAEAAALIKRAEDRGLTVSEYIRRQAMRGIG